MSRTRRVLRWCGVELGEGRSHATSWLSRADGTWYPATITPSQVERFYLQRAMTMGQMPGDGSPEYRSGGVIEVPFNMGGAARRNDPVGALAVIPVFAATRLIADALSTLPLKVYRKKDLSDPLSDSIELRLPPLFVQPSVHGTFNEWLHRLITSLSLQGNGYAVITSRDSLGFPTGAEWQAPTDVSIEDGNLSGPGSYMNPRYRLLGKEIPRFDPVTRDGALLHIPWFPLAGKVEGLSPVGAYRSAVNVGYSVQNFTETWFENGGTPPGTFQNTQKVISRDDADVITERTVNRLRTRKPLVYGADWVYNPISMNANDVQFVETTRMTATQVANIYGLPPEMIGGLVGESLTYSTVEQRNLQVVMALRSWMVKIENYFNLLLPRGQYVKFQEGMLIRADSKTRADIRKTDHEIGFRTINEMRAEDDLPPLPGGDKAPGALAVPGAPQPAAEEPQQNEPKPEQPASNGNKQPQPANANGQARRYLDWVPSVPPA